MHVEKLDKFLNEAKLVYAFIKVSCAKSSLSSVSPNVWCRKKRLMGDWYFLTKVSNARVFLKTTTCATNAMSLIWLIFILRCGEYLYCSLCFVFLWPLRYVPVQYFQFSLIWLRFHPGLFG